MEDVDRRLAALEERLGVLVADNERLRVLNEELVAENAGPGERVAALEAERDRDSDNSSKPPSADPVGPRKKRAERRAEQRQAGRKRGGQKGSPGSSLERRTPDDTVVHAPVLCPCCGDDLADAPVVGTETRQVIDVPAVEAIVSDHVVEKRRCGCGTVTAGEFPPEARAPVCWGPRVRALAIYLVVRQHLPIGRAAEMLSDVIGAPVSWGWLCAIQQEAHRLLGPFLDEVRAQLRDAAVVHADETGTRVVTADGEVGRHWVHVACTDMLTLLLAHRTRSAEAIVEMDVLVDFDGTIVHDGYTTYDTLIGDKTFHAQCGLHLLRHLTAVGENPVFARWTSQMSQILLEAKRHAETAAEAEQAKVPARQAARIRRRYDQTIDVALSLLPLGSPPPRRHTGGWSVSQREAWNLATRLRRDKQQVLRLLNDTRVPLDNNQAERDLRMVKLHDKISGTFRSTAGAQAYAGIRSYVQTAAKHGLNQLAALEQLFTTGPWLPPPRPAT